MRKDCTIDGRQVYCPNASTLGYGVRLARVGYVIQYQYPGSEDIRTARAIGRVRYAPKIDAGDVDPSGSILALEFGYMLSHLMERWIDPAWVIGCMAPDRFAAWMAFAFGGDLPTGEKGRRVAEYGALSLHPADNKDYAEYCREILSKQ